jgi:hypothetical protein
MLRPAIGLRQMSHHDKEHVMQELFRMALLKLEAIQ